MSRRRTWPSIGSGVASTLVAVTIVVSLAAVSASAQRVRSGDPRGDAKAAADILSVTYNNGSGRLGALASFRNLKRHGSVGLTMQKPKWSGRALLLRVVKSRRGHLRSGLYRERPDGAFYQLRCDVTGSWHPVKDRVRVWAPQRCFRRNKGNWLMWTFARAAGDLDFTRTTKVLFD